MASIGQQRSEMWSPWRLDSNEVNKVLDHDALHAAVQPSQDVLCLVIYCWRTHVSPILVSSRSSLHPHFCIMVQSMTRHLWFWNVVAETVRGTSFDVILWNRLWRDFFSRKIIVARLVKYLLSLRFHITLLWNSNGPLLRAWVHKINHSLKTSDISYHHIPKDKGLQKAWIARIPRDNLLPIQNCYVCSEHFTDSLETDLRAQLLPEKKGKRRLKHDAIPSVFSFRTEES